ncbi:response regulator [Microbacterium imperiale]|uniref:DNA-binding response regulator n=1 Tax=Microbacterium imperiale TaxID=33884 RepID=A0A9W6M4N2_9MICO|nr:response regulator transcription factor [Microbacterium imperiale]MBP2421662.1 DNA-binding NarL/FixJ family response regulator [Microbacterium imperiale]MDS0199235.1 response regulator transcription factor [Microbacterium imperiale]BFE42004.1 response regulator transcription factor [Microbacterium imperiale]GLJ80957.1 DNA-binding response regulator [Microbacterium imperiale]
MRILICEDSALLREGLVRLLADSGHDIVAAVAHADGLGTVVADSRPDLCILDVRLPPTFTDEGIRAALALRAENPELPILVLSQYVEERYASELITSHGAALGYLLKDRVADVAEFVATVERIGQGATVLDPEVVAQLLTRRSRDERLARLTERERTVLALIAEGRSNQAIAAAMFLSEASVEKYITSLFQKLDLEQDEHGNRRVLAALVHLEHGGSQPQNGAVR